MSEIEKQVEDGALTAVDECQQQAGPSARPSTGEVPARDDHSEAREVIGKPAGRCHHSMESGYYCQSPALRGRRYCYSHLRLRGERLRMARAIARRLPYRYDLPALDDLYAVQVAVEQVARALGAGLLERRQAGTLLYALQQSAINHRILALVRMHTSSSAGPTLAAGAAQALAAGAPPLSSSIGEKVGDGNQQRLVEEYPEFEAEFGLPAGLDLSQPPHLIFPPPEDAWRVPIPAHDPKASAWIHRQPRKNWTKEDIEQEMLEKDRKYMGEEYYKQSHQLSQRITQRERKLLEATWQAEADRRNAADDEQERQYASMNEGERSAYHLGVLRGLQAAEERAEEEERKKPVTKAG